MAGGGRSGGNLVVSWFNFQSPHVYSWKCLSSQTWKAYVSPASMKRWSMGALSGTQQIILHPGRRGAVLWAAAPGTHIKRPAPFLQPRTGVL